MIYIGVIFAIIAGVCVALQGSVNGFVGGQVGVFPTILVPIAIQIVLLMGLLFVKRELVADSMKLSTMTNGWWLLLFSAFLGLGLLSFMTLSIIKIGPLMAFGIIVFTQLLISMLLEHFGLFGAVQSTVNMSKLAGLLCVMGGVFLFYRK